MALSYQRRISGLQVGRSTFRQCKLQMAERVALTRRSRASSKVILNFFFADSVLVFAREQLPP
jgi:hypothetical protein